LTSDAKDAWGIFARFVNVKDSTKESDDSSRRSHRFMMNVIFREFSGIVFYRLKLAHRKRTKTLHNLLVHGMATG
jgi:hypothetical protein